MVLIINYDINQVIFALLLQDEKDKKIQELTTELRNKKRLCATYQEQLNAFMKMVEEHSEQLSKKVQNVVDNLKEFEPIEKELLPHRQSLGTQSKCFFTLPSNCTRHFFSYLCSLYVEVYYILNFCSVYVEVISSRDFMFYIGNPF